MRWRRKKTESLFTRKQQLAREAGGRYYGNGGTIHHSGLLDVETFGGTVVSVWFRCQPIPFQQCEVDGPRAHEMERMNGLPDDPFHGAVLTGVEIQDEAW